MSRYGILRSFRTVDGFDISSNLACARFRRSHDRRNALEALKLFRMDLTQFLALLTAILLRELLVSQSFSRTGKSSLYRPLLMTSCTFQRLRTG